MSGSDPSRVTRVLAGVSVAAALLSACSDSDPQTQPPTSSPTSPQITAASTATPSEPTPPALPALAKEDSKAGAKAFVGWYVDLFTYSANTGDVATFSKYGADCASCQNYVSEIADTYAQGGAFKSVDWADDGYYVAKTQDGYFVSVSIRASSYARRLDVSGHFESSPAESFDLSFQVRPTPMGMRVESLRVPS